MLFTLLCCCAIGAVTPIEEANLRLGRGVNFGNALEAPAEGEWGITVREQDLRAIKAAGFDSVRLPTKWSAHAGTTAPYTLDETFAKRVDTIVDQATAVKLNIVLNIHHYNELDADPEAHTNRVVALWEQIARRYASRPANVYFELYNEPHDKLSEAKWNALILRLLKVVRTTNPTRPIIVGPAQYNAIWALPKLQLPADDTNLILTFHYYDPFEFTHQGAEWSEGSKKWIGRTFNGTETQAAAVRKAFDTVANWAAKGKRPVYLGEFGAYNVAPMPSRVRWTKLIAQEAAARRFSWAYWEFAAGFGVYDRDANDWRAPLRDALLASPAKQ